MSVREKYSEFEQARSAFEQRKTEAREATAKVSKNIQALRTAHAANLQAGLDGQELEDRIFAAEDELKRLTLRAEAVAGQGMNEQIRALGLGVIEAGREATKAVVERMQEADRDFEALKAKILALLTERAQAERDHEQDVDCVKKVAQLISEPIDLGACFPPAFLRARSKYFIGQEEVDAAMGRIIMWPMLRD